MNRPAAVIQYREMTPSDIPAGLSLCRSAGWNQLARDWELFLKLSPAGCRVATTESNQVVGTVTTLRYQELFSWVGMVLVDPEYQRQGIGTQLLEEALRILKNDTTIKLDATPAGRKVYLKLNFTDEYRISRMLIENVHVKLLPPSPARPLQPKDLFEVAKLDGRIFGADRTTVLKSNFSAAPQFAFALIEQNTLTGYCLGRPGHNFNHIGPVIAKDVRSAIHLVSASLRNSSDKPTVIDILHHSPEWIDFICAIGFSELRPLIRMYRGSNAYPGIPENQFAILGPEFG